MSGHQELLSDINIQYAGVKNIVHTAVVNDATIAATNAAGFENVLRWFLEPARRQSTPQSRAGFIRSLQ